MTAAGAGSGGDRLAALDSVRGIAAAVVLAHHALLILPPPFPEPTMAALRVTPLAPLLSGQPAVIVFFALSGLVLTIALERGQPYLAYAAARLVRLWLPLAAAVLLAVTLALAFGGRASGAGLVDWFPRVGFNRPEAIDAGLVLRHLALTGRLGDEGLDTVIWSLAIEVRASLLMPLIVLAVRRGGIGAVAAFAGLGLLAEAALVGLVPGVDRRLLFGDGLFLVDDAVGTALATVVALPAFAIGSWIAQHRRRLAERPPSRRTAAALALLAALGLGAPVVGVVAAASGLVLVLAIGPSATARTLERPAPRWLGRISYSLYLVHFPVLFAAANLLADRIGAPAAAAAGVVAALAVATLFHARVEAPAVRLARRTARWIAGARVNPSGRSAP